MADLQRLQQQIDQITPLLKEVRSLRPMTPAVVRGYMTEVSYSVEALDSLSTHIDEWKEATAAALKAESGEEYAAKFSNIWTAPFLRQYTYKDGLTKRFMSSGRLLMNLVEEGENTGEYEN